MKSISFVPKIVPAVWMGYVMQGWGVVCHAGVVWVIQGLGGSHKGGMTHTEHYDHLHTDKIHSLLLLYLNKKASVLNIRSHFGHPKVCIQIFKHVTNKFMLINVKFKKVNFILQEKGGCLFERVPQFE